MIRELLEKTMLVEDFKDKFKPISDEEYGKRFKGKYLFVLWFEVTHGEEGVVNISIDRIGKESEYSSPDGLLVGGSIEDLVDHLAYRDVDFAAIVVEPESKFTDEERKKLVNALSIIGIEVEFDD